MDARDPDSGWTSLHFASRAGRLEATQVLIKNKASIDARGPDGRTPLHLAAEFGTHQVTPSTGWGVNSASLYPCQHFFNDAIKRMV